MFLNRFGQDIREDILNLAKVCYTSDETMPCAVGRAVARDALNAAVSTLPRENHALLAEALERANEIEGTPVFDSSGYSYYQTRDRVMMVKESRDEPNGETCSETSNTTPGQT